MINKLFISFLFFCLNASHAADFSSISLKGWVKEEISADHLRFTHPQKKMTVHLQVDSFDSSRLWNEKSLIDDINQMVSLRQKMSSFFGITAYKISSYKFKPTSEKDKIPRLSLSGSYYRGSQSLIYFSENNFYYKKHFLQVKLIGGGNIPSDKEVEDVIKEINHLVVDIK